MFTKNSRYFKVSQVAAPDAQGRVLAAKDLRLLPAVQGTFRHTIQSGDRLDQLSFIYYSQPLQWWHINDANPQFLSPLEMLGQEPVVTQRFPVSVIAGDPPWAALFQSLRGVMGIEDVQVQELVQLVPQQQVVNGQSVTVVVERFERSVSIVYNRLNVTSALLAQQIEAAGFQVGAPVDTSQLGHEIIIPPKVTGG